MLSDSVIDMFSPTSLTLLFRAFTCTVSDPQRDPERLEPLGDPLPEDEHGDDNHGWPSKRGDHPPGELHPSHAWPPFSPLRTFTARIEGAARHCNHCASQCAAWQISTEQVNPDREPPPAVPTRRPSGH